MRRMDEKLAQAREHLLKLSEAAEADGEPLRWFDELYAGAGRDSDEIPWAKMEANPRMVEWLSERPEITGRALVVGCGLGDDAEWLSAAGFEVTAFDISQSSIDWCQERFQESEVNYHVADLLSPRDEWKGTFDLIVEIHILQAMPEKLREVAVKHIPLLLAEGGHLLCVGRLQTEREPDEPAPPWPLAQVWLENRFHELIPLTFQRFVLNDTPTIDRYVATWIRGTAAV